MEILVCLKLAAAASKLAPSDPVTAIVTGSGGIVEDVLEFITELTEKLQEL